MPTPSFVPLPGDEGFLDFIAGLHDRGLLATGEALERQRTHEAIVRAGAT